jgi:hypothetical protein
LDALARGAAEADIGEIGGGRQPFGAVLNDVITLVEYLSGYVRIAG